MKISDVIRQLSTLRAMHKTDFEVKLCSGDNYGSCHAEIGTIQLQQNEELPYVLLI